MERADKLRAAIGHLASGVVGIVAATLGALWVAAAGELVAVPATIIVLALIALTPIAVRRHWSERGAFVDHHVQAASRFLTAVGVAAILAIGVPVLVSWPLPSGTALWSSILVLPFLAALVLPLTWAFFALRAAVLAFRAKAEPYPRWATPFPG